MRSIPICFQLLLGTGIDAVLQMDDQTFFSSSGIDHNAAPGLNRKKKEEMLTVVQMTR